MTSRLEKAINHYHKGEKEKALAGFLKSAELSPDSTVAHFNAAVIYHQFNDLKKAVHHYRLAHKTDPEDPDILFNLAISLKELGRIEEALDCYYANLETNPGDTETRYNLGMLLMEKGLMEEAASFFRKVLAIDPSHAPACNNLAYLYHRLGMTSEALETYNLLLELNPAHKTAAHMKAALTGDNPDHPPPEYIRDVFDQFQDYDKTMQDNLRYNIPRELGNLLCDCLPEKKQFDHVLDLGCGTGLAGPIFRSMTKRLTGIDLSINMLTQAEKKQIYDKLRQEEIVSFLRNTGQQYDLFLAADVFVYSGDLLPVMGEIGKRSQTGGLLLFSTELAEKDFSLKKTGRYAHSADYLKKTAGQCGFHLLQSRAANIRKEKGEWIKGGFYLFGI
ncbi:MAG: tetratricopeptide repeat protein [Desulfobia sp.]